MKGITDYYGRDQLHFLLLNNGGNANREVAMADDCIERYGMQGFPRIRMEHEAFARNAVSCFGHFSYGYIVIGSDGLLKGVNVSSHDCAALIAEAVAPGDADLGDDEFEITTAVRDKQGGRVLWDISNRLPQKMTARLDVTLSIPDGWHVYGAAKANPEPTVLTVRHSGGLVFGDAVFPEGVGAPGGAMHLQGPVKISVPVEAAVGTPIGNYLVHGVLRFMACNDERCLPPMELPWTVKVAVF